MARGNAEILLPALHQQRAPGFYGEPATVAEDGAWQRDRRRLEIRPYPASTKGYFDRLRARTQALNDAGIYAGIYLFTGEFINLFRCASDGYPFTGANNVNGIDDGYTSGPKGMASMTMTAPNAITRYQDAFVEKVIDTLNDLPNVLWIVSEEAPSDTEWFNYYEIAHIRKYEAGKPHQHPIGLAGLLPANAATDAILYNSNADWVAPNSTISPITSCGSGRPACKVNVNDSDHSYFGASVEGYTATESQLRMEKLRQRQPGAVHGPLPALLPAREQEPCVSLPPGESAPLPTSAMTTSEIISGTR